MADKKYQVFISSTYMDLIEERRAIIENILVADCIPAGMEAFVATDDEQFEVIKKVIDLCDYYVLVIGKRYGTVNLDTKLSYTEMEYDYAIEKQIPVLVFAIDEKVTLSSDKEEQETTNIEKLKCFREKAMKSRMASVWKDSSELALYVSHSINSAKANTPRLGWQRATDYDEASLRRKIMDMQLNKLVLEKELATAKEQIQMYLEQNDVAFEDVTVNARYNYFRDTGGRIHVDKEVSLEMIFTIVATQMMDVMIPETSISNILLEKLTGTSYDHYFSDTQFVKTILNQFRAIGLINPSWRKEKSLLLWGLTKKGQKIRDDRILIRNSEEE